MEKNKKWISLTVLVTFLWLSHLASMPLPAAAGDESVSPMAVERTAPSKPVAKKKSILPYILIGAGVLAAAAALYFLVLKGDSEKIHDDFDDGADALWVPRTAAAWTVAGGFYVVDRPHNAGDNTKWWEWSLYNRAWSKANYTITTRMRISGNNGIFGLLLTTDASMTAANGYQIMFYNDGKYLIRRVEGWNYTNSTAAGYTWIQNWTNSSAINPGANAWNTYKLVKAGGSYNLYANDTLVYSFTDATYDPRLVALAVHTQSQAMHLEVDSFYVDLD